MISTIHVPPEFGDRVIAGTSLSDPRSCSVGFIQPSAAVRTRPRLSKSGVRGLRAYLGRLRASRRRLRQEIAHPDQVVPGHHAKKVVADTFQPSELGLAQTADLLRPAKGLFDSLACPLAECVTPVTSGPGIDRRATSAVEVLGDVGCDAQASQVRDEVPGVVPLVRPQGGARFQADGHVERRLSFRRARRLRELGIDEQAVAVLDQRVCGVARATRHAVALGGQQGLGVGARGVRFVAAPLAMEVSSGIAPDTIGVVVVGAVLAPYALVRGPGGNKGAVHAEVVIRGEAVVAGHLDDLLEQPSTDVGLGETIPVLGKRRCIPHRLIDAHPHEPAKHQVVVELLHELSLAANRVDHLQQRGPDQALRRNRGAAIIGVDLVEGGVQMLERLVDNPAHLANRVVGGNPLLQRHIAEQIPAFLIVTAHGSTSLSGSRYFPLCRGLFQQPVKRFHNETEAFILI